MCGRWSVALSFDWAQYRNRCTGLDHAHPVERVTFDASKHMRLPKLADFVRSTL